MAKSEIRDGEHWCPKCGGHMSLFCEADVKERSGLIGALTSIEIANIRTEKEKATKLLDEFMVLFKLWEEDYSIINQAKIMIAASKKANPNYPITLSLFDRLEKEGYLKG